MALQLGFDKATCISLWDEKEVIQREPLADEEKGKDRASLWRAVRKFPSGTKRQQVKHHMEPAQKLNYALDLQPSRVNENSCFLQFKDNRNLVLYPEVTMGKKLKKGQKELWPPDAQEWIIAQVSYFIRLSSAFVFSPSLCFLGVLFFLLAFPICQS